MMRLKKLALCLAMVIVSLTLPAQDAVNGSSEKSPLGSSFQVRNTKFGDLLRPEDANSATGTRIVLYPAQPWKCMTWKMVAARDAGFSLQNHFTGKTFAVDPKSSSHAVVQAPFAKEASERPLWRSLKLADGTHKIIESKTGDVLTAVKGADGTVTIITAAWQDKDEQKWELVKTDPSKLTM